MTEWIVWATETGRVELTDGRMVVVAYGDELLAEETDTGIAFHDYRAKTLH